MSVMPVNLSTDDSEYLFPLKKLNKKKETSTKLPPIQKKQKRTMVIEVVLGSNTRVLMDKIITEEEIPNIQTVKESIQNLGKIKPFYFIFYFILIKKDVPLEKKEIPLKMLNLNQNHPENKIKEKIQSLNWVEESIVGLNHSKTRKESLQISSLKSFDLEGDLKEKRKQTLRSKSFLIGKLEAEHPLEKISALENSPTATLKSLAKQRKIEGTKREN